MQPPIPAAFLTRMERLLQDEFSDFVATYTTSPVTALRANTLKIGPEDLAARLPFLNGKVPWSSDAFLVSDEARPGKHPYHAAGLYYLQEPSALAPVILLDPKPGERILDVSAAPGGKATDIASRLQGEGLLVANEVVQKRAWELAGNLERWGARNAAITSEPAERLVEHFEAFFDAVLVDAPCSGEGMFRKSAAARQDWSPALVEGCAVRQDKILDAAARLVRPGGRLVYSTCTFAPEEDEGRIAAFLRAHPEFTIVRVPPRHGFSAGRPDWLPHHGRAPGLENAVRLWPHTGPGEGHFAALLRRDAGPAGAANTRTATTGLVRGAEAVYRRWCAENLLSYPFDRLVVEGSYLYRLPDGLPDRGRLRTVHPGWWLGSLKGDRFEPSHALALALRADEAIHTVDLAPDSREVVAYLRGELLDGMPGDDGHVLVTVDRHSLGWARRVGDRLKNLYPKGLRWY